MSETPINTASVPAQASRPEAATSQSAISPDFLRQTFTSLHEVTVLAGNLFVDAVAEDLAANPKAAIDKTRNLRISEGMYDLVRYWQSKRQKDASCRDRF